VQQTIERELGRRLSVDDLSRRASMSRRNFVRPFARATSNSPGEYIQRVRIEAAKRALEDGKDSVTKIARGIGYQDPVAFRKVFASRHGAEPNRLPQSLRSSAPHGGSPLALGSGGRRFGLGRSREMFGRESRAWRIVMEPIAGGWRC
jgi:transcriptional regulator GlxA family with amidase domain